MVRASLWALALCGLSIPAQASEWKLIETYTNGNQFYIDGSSYRVVPDGFTMWVKEQLVSDGGNVKAMWRVDCSHWTVATTSKVAYGPDGSLVATLEPTPSGPIAPDTAGEGLAKVFCPKK